MMVEGKADCDCCLCSLTTIAATESIIELSTASILLGTDSPALLALVENKASNFANNCNNPT